jgi:hypothetical protein
MIHSFTVTFGEQYLTGIVTSVPPYETFSLIKNNIVCCAHSYLYPQSRFKFLAKRLKSLTIWEQVNPIPMKLDNKHRFNNRSRTLNDQH